MVILLRNFGKQEFMYQMLENGIFGLYAVFHASFGVRVLYFGFFVYIDHTFACAL